MLDNFLSVSSQIFSMPLYFIFNFISKTFPLYCFTKYNWRIICLFSCILDSLNDFLDIVSINNLHLPSRSSKLTVIYIHVVLEFGRFWLPKSININKQSQVMEGVVLREFNGFPNTPFCQFSIACNTVYTIIDGIEIFTGICHSCCYR